MTCWISHVLTEEKLRRRSGDRTPFRRPWLSIAFAVLGALADRRL
jgi:hypothetical protein